MRWTLLLLPVAIAACGSSGEAADAGPPGPRSGTVTGDVGGQTLVPKDATFSTTTTSTGSADISYLSVVVSDHAKACVSTPGTTSVLLQIEQSTDAFVDTGAPIPAGTYPIGTKGHGSTSWLARAFLTVVDAQCNNALPMDSAVATDGSVTLDMVADDQIQGSFDLTFANGAMQGRFNAALFQCTPDVPPPPDACP